MESERALLYWIGLSLCLWITGYGSLVASAESADSTGRPIKVGFILPLSGDLAFLGNGIRDGALLAAQDINSNGVTIELFFEDNRGEVAPSVSKAHLLIDSQKVDALISIISGVAKIIKPIASRAQVLSIGICSDTDAADGRYSFVNYLTAEQGAAKFLEHYRRTSKVGDSIGVYAQNEPGFLKIIEELKHQGDDSLGISFVEIFDRGVTDFRSRIVKNRNAKPSSWLILGLSPEIELLVKQARGLGITVPVTSIEGFGLASDKTPFEGGWFVDSGVPNLSFRERFEMAYGREVTPGVGHSYDSLLLIAEAFKSSDQTPRMHDRKDAIRKFRQIERISGVLGDLTVRSDGVIWSEPTVKVIRNGRPILLED